MDHEIVNCFCADLLRFSGKSICWGIAAGTGTGSMATLYFGGKRPRARPLKNLRLSEEVRKYEGEYCLYLEDCDWRIQTRDEVIASSVSSNKEGGAMLLALESLVGESVVNAKVDKVSFDLRIRFGNGAELMVFCFGKSDEELDNYTFYLEECHYVSRFDGCLEKGKAEGVDV